jgi:hypothetical protein
MPKLARLYLDTARLGPMSPGAQLAVRDFARLAGEGVSTLYWQQFLQRGFSGLEPYLQQRLPGLVSWRGISELKASLRRLLSAPPSAPIFLAGRTVTLARMASRVLCSRSRNVLICDTLWPPYERILREECLRQNCEITAVPLRNEAVDERLTADQVSGKVSNAYQRHECDGILLSSISSDGIRLPVEPILRKLRSLRRPPLAIIDGAQELAHAPVDLKSAGADLYLAGCHKWLGAPMPLGVCCVAHPASNAELVDDLQFAQQSFSSEDPLLEFLTCLQGGTTSASHSETVNLISLACAAGALSDLARCPRPLNAVFSDRRLNADRLACHAKQFGWAARQPDSAELRSGILLLQSTQAHIRRLAAAELQGRTDADHVILTAYDDGLVRLSLPDEPLRDWQLTRIAQALHSVNQSRRPTRRLHHDRPVPASQ